MQYDTDSQVSQESSEVSRKLAFDLSLRFAPLLAARDAQVDVRLVRTFLATIAVMIQFRNRAQGFLLSELGAYLLSPQHAPAGTKRISNAARARTSGEVLSGPPIVVRGLEWTAVMLAGLTQAPTVVAMKWWSRTGQHAPTQRQVERALLCRLAGAWGERVLHIFARGYARRNWVAALQEAEVRFLIRWQKGHVVWDAVGQQRKIWQLIRGKRPQERREVYDARFHSPRLMGINVLSFRHPGYAAPLWLVVARPAGGKEPC